MSDSLYTAALIAVMSLVTILLRALPFWIFRKDQQLPEALLYLGRVLPSAALGMLVVYCLKDLNFSSPAHGIYELLAGFSVVLTQILKKNTILSILVGTLFYMLLIRL